LAVSGFLGNAVTDWMNAAGGVLAWGAVSRREIAMHSVYGSHADGKGCLETDAHDFLCCDPEI